MAKKEDKRQIAIQLSETGAALADRGQFRDALKHYDKALDFCPKLAEALFQKGLVHLRLGWHGQDQKKNFYNALKLFEETLKLNPHWKHVLSYVGDAHLMLGILGDNPKDNFSGAVNAYNAVIKLNPNAGPDLCGKGYALLELGKLEENTKKKKRIFTGAETAFIGLLKLNPDDPYGVCGRGRALLELEGMEKDPLKRQERLEKAGTYCKEAVDLASGSDELTHFIETAFFDDAIGLDKLKKTKPVGLPKFLVLRLMERKEIRGIRQNLRVLG